MNRSQKIALLTRVFERENAEANRKLLANVVENGARGLILVDDLDSPTGPLSDDSTVSFYDRNQHHRMSLLEAHTYAKRHRINTLLVLPDNGRMPTHEAQ